MKVTAKTTDEQLFAPIQAARKALAEAAAGDEVDGCRLAGYVNDVASAEGAANARYRYRAVMRQDGGTHEKAMAHVVALMFNGADDTWSGRGNDAKRAKFDGYCEAANRMQWQED